MYEIKTVEHFSPKYQKKFAVLNSDGDILCEFRLLEVAADFVNYIQGGTLTETQKFHVDEEIRNFRNFRKQ